MLAFFLAPVGLGKILRNSQNIRAYYMLNHRIRCIYSMSARWIANEARSAELAITSLISNKCEWNNCFSKFFNKNLRNTSENHLVIRHLGSSQKKHFLPFRVLLNVGIDPNFPQRVFLFFFGFIPRKISLSGENIFSLATRSAIIYHIRSN